MGLLNFHNFRMKSKLQRCFSLIHRRLTELTEDHEQVPGFQGEINVGSHRSWEIMLLWGYSPYPGKGELLNPCRCDGSVRYTHQLCLLKWISERGSWTCELCCYRYHVIAIKMKQPCQWQSISITLVEKVQMIAVILGSLFLIASVTWLLWSAFSPYAVWQRKDVLFQICYGMYGFMDLVCIGLIVHEGAAVYRVFKRWRAVNLHWDVLNYDKATDIEESSRGQSSTSRTLWLPLTALRNRNLVHPTQLTSPRFQCGYVLLHLFNRMRPHEDLSEENSSGEVVMRVTSV
nr:PREDICTED: E3 ubiquitin-protein ligase MARCH11 [Rhinolophus sinicus]